MCWLRPADGLICICEISWNVIYQKGFLQAGRVPSAPRGIESCMQDVGARRVGNSGILDNGEEYRCSGPRGIGNDCDPQPQSRNPRHNTNVHIVEKKHDSKSLAP